VIKMPTQVICLKIPKRQGEKALNLANRLKLLDKELEIEKDDDFLYIPLARQPSPNDLETLKNEVAKVEVSTRLFRERKKNPTLLDLLEPQLPPHLMNSLPHAIDFVGEIAIIEIPPELEPYKKIIGEALLEVHTNVRTVLAKAGAVHGAYRLRQFKVIAGEPSTETLHKESGCLFSVDVAAAYFSPRLSNEHKRIGSLVHEGETVVDLFAGVGPFAILIAKSHEKVRVYAIDANPKAVDYLRTNIRLNRVLSKVHPFLGDARQITIEKLSGIADRVIMNLPENAIDYVDAACSALKSEGGIIHFYCFIRSPASIEDAKLALTKSVEKSGRRVEVFLISKRVRETAPFEWQAVIDARIR
jgi:tRNA (guanine37-N1)-methyltransferase